MNQFFRSLAIRLRNHINYDAFFKDELKRTILTFIVGLIGIGVFAVFLASHLYRNAPIRSVMVTLGMVMFGWALRLIWIGRISLAKCIMVITAALCITINASFSGRYSGEIFIWFPVVAAIFTGFTFREKNKIVISLIIVLVCVVFLEATDYSFFLNETQKETEQQVYLHRMLTFGISLVLVMLYVYFLMRFNEETELKLHKVNSCLENNLHQLRKKNQELDSFVSRAAHDLKAPLSSILGLVTLIKSADSIEEINQYVLMQEKTATKMNMFISEMLDLSLNDRTELAPQKMDFHIILNDIFNQLNYMGEASKIIKHLNISEKANFYSDSKRVEIILSNILSNSIRYFDANKKSNYIDINISIENDFAKINIKDNGLGISNDHIPKVFDMFFRGSTSKKGTGFGLYIVKETINKLKGNINLTSELGQWTNFEITIPNLINENQ